VENRRLCVKCCDRCYFPELLARNNFRLAHPLAIGL
jgi:hypothetical protein